jgi:hypothetical protein
MRTMTDEEIGQKAKKTATCKTVERLRRVGLTRSYTYTKLKSLCEAQKTVSCISGKDAGSGSVDFVEVPDNQVQLGAVKEVIALFGDRAAEKRDVNLSGDVSIQLVDYSNADPEAKQPVKAHRKAGKGGRNADTP